MLTQHELLCAAVIPALASLVIAAAGCWRRWSWVMPLAVGAGFIGGYAAMGVPRLPPRDGSDWLFWLAIAVTIAGVLGGRAARWLGWMAGIVVWVVLRPLPVDFVPPGMLWGLSAMVGAVGFALVFCIGHAEPKLGVSWVIGALVVVAAAGGIVVFSSNLRIVGIYGMMLSAALAPAAALSFRMQTGAGVAALAISIIAGVLACGRFYPDPGLSWTNFWVVLVAPALLPAAGLVRVGRPWQRGLAALLAIAIAVAAVAVPTALSAKSAAEEPDPYGY